MTTTRIRIRLNQQQLELIDNSVKAGEGKDRVDLVRRALKEFVQARLTSSTAGE